MNVTRTSPFTGKVHTLDLPITQGQLDKWNQGARVQDVFPTLTPGQREFILTGLTEKEWTEVFGE